MAQKDLNLISEYYFPNTVVGSSSAPVEFSIINNGTTELVITSLLLDGGDVEDFDFDYDPELLTVPPGGSFIVTVWFKPNKKKDRDFNNIYSPSIWCKSGNKFGWFSRNRRNGCITILLCGS